MHAQYWGVDEAQRLTHHFVPRIVGLAAQKGVLSTFQNADWTQGIEGWNERYALSLTKLIVFADAQRVSSDQSTGTDLSMSPLFEQLKAFYESADVAGSSSFPVDIFGNVEDQDDGPLALTLQVHLESKLSLSTRSMGSMSRAWKAIRDMESHESVQCAYWLFESLGLDMSMGTKIAVALMGMRLLKPDRWLLPGCELEEAFWRHREGLLSLSHPKTGESVEEYYVRVGYLVFDVLQDAMSNRVQVLEPPEEASASVSELVATQKRLSKNEKQALATFRADPEMILPELAKLLGVANRTAQRIARSLCERGLLSRVGSKKSGLWVVVDEDLKSGCNSSANPS